MPKNAFFPFRNPSAYPYFLAAILFPMNLVEYKKWAAPAWGTARIAISVHERNVHRLLRQSTVAFPLQQPSPSPQDELLFKAGLLARVRSTGTPSQRFRQWSQRAFVALTVGRSCFGFAPNSLFTAPSRNWRDTLNLSAYIIRQTISFGKVVKHSFLSLFC